MGLTPTNTGLMCGKGRSFRSGLEYFIYQLIVRNLDRPILTRAELGAKNQAVRDPTFKHFLVLLDIGREELQVRLQTLQATSFFLAFSGSQRAALMRIDGESVVAHLYTCVKVRLVHLLSRDSLDNRQPTEDERAICLYGFGTYLASRAPYAGRKEEIMLPDRYEM